MRTSHRFTAALVAVSGVGLLAAAAPAAADTTISLANCSSWSIVNNAFNCVNTTPPVTTINVPITVPTGTVSTGGGGGGNTGGGISCAPKGTVVMPMNWPASQTSIRTLSSGVGEFGNSTVLVSKFTTGSKNGIGRLSVAEYASGPVLRTTALSANACGFGAGAAFTTRIGTGATMYFSIGSNSYGYPVLQPNTTYYFNVMNEYDGVSACPGSSCDVSVDLKAP